MRRLTLIVSDLYLRDDEAREMAPDESAPMPNLEWLLRYAPEARRIADWRSWLGSELGYATADLQPIGAFCARGLSASPRDAWLATPVHLAARIDHVRLDARGVLRLDGEHNAAWRDAFARTFGPRYALHDDGCGGFLLSGIAPEVRAQTVTDDPARLLGVDVGAHLPRGATAGEARRLGAEIEMWLHGTALNDARVRSGLLPVTALWLWGTGAGTGAADPLTVSRPHAVADLFGEDPFVAALARDAGLVMGGLERASFEPKSPRGRAPWVVVVLSPWSGASPAGLPVVEAWMGTARQWVEQGLTRSLDLVANDHHWRIGAKPQWRFWRRHRGWVEQLVRPAGGAKA